MERRARQLFRHIPQGPRCKICAAPFGGPGAPFMRAIGKRPSDKNPAMCNSCFVHIAKRHGGAEIEASFLFADIRGSTALAERMSPSGFRALIDRFYVAASTAVFDHDGGVDKLGAVGDERRMDITALGDPVNTTARLAAVARAAEVLVTVEAAEAAGLDRALEQRDLEGKGKQSPTRVVSLLVERVPAVAR